MKLLLLILTTVATCLSLQNPNFPTSDELQAQYGEALEAILGIGVRLQALLEDPTMTNTNFFISPLSAALVVGQLMLGAEGKFRRELYNLLSIPSDSSSERETIIGSYNQATKNKTNYLLAYSKLHLQMGNLFRALEYVDNNKHFTLSTSNALFYNKNIKLQDHFTHNLGIYQTYIAALNFNEDPLGSQKFINDWAARETNNLIKNILSSPLSSRDSSIFTNAIYFKADWETPFSYEVTINGDFKVNQNKIVQVEYMRGIFEKISYGESAKLGCKMIALPYKSEQVAMYLLLPNENNGEEYNIKHFAKNLNIKDVLEFINQTKKRNVNVQLPKLKLSNKISILKPLQKYDIYKRQQEKKPVQGNPLDVLEELVDEFASFNTTENVDLYLTKAAVNESLKISDILQQVTLSVDEKGTEAAAVTSSIVNYSGGNKNFKIDRPFMFFILHEYTSVALFWGTIVDPSLTA